MWTKAYWKALAERVLGVAAATFGGLLSADTFNLLTANWGDVFSATGLAALTTLVLALAATLATTSNGPSFTSKKTEDELAE